MNKLVILFLFTSALIIGQTKNTSSEFVSNNKNSMGESTINSFGLIVETFFLFGEQINYISDHNSKLHGGLSFFIQFKNNNKFFIELRSGIKYISFELMGLDLGLYGKSYLNKNLYFGLGINTFFNLNEEPHNGGNIKSGAYFSLIGLSGYKISKSISIFFSYSYLINNEFGYALTEVDKSYPIIINSILSMGISFEL